MNSTEDTALQVDQSRDTVKLDVNNDEPYELFVTDKFVYVKIPARS